jgi:hypothetical protein
MCLGFADSPLGFSKFKHAVLGSGQRGEARFDRRFPGEGLTGGEGGGVREPHGFKAHLWVLGIEARAVGEGVSTASGGLRARSTAAGWLRWCSGEGKWPRSCARSRRC